MRDDATTDYGDGFRAGFEAARAEILKSVENALANHTSIRKAILRVEVPAAMRDLTGLEVRGG